MLKLNVSLIYEEILMQVEEAVFRYDETCLPPSHAQNAVAYIQSDTTNKTCITKWTVCTLTLY